MCVIYEISIEKLVPCAPKPRRNVKCQTDGMLKISALFCSLLLCALKTTCALDYCKDVRMDCGGGHSNIVCRRNNDCDASGNCKEIPIHKDVKDFFLDKINGIRNSVALGQGPLSGKTASDMRAMSWNEELAYIARCAVNVCETRLKSACPVASKFKNPHIIYTNRLDVLFDDDFNFFNETIKTWNAFGNGMSGLSDFGGSKNDYAALIMAKSTAVGCGWSRVINAIFYHNYNGHYYFAACVFAEMPHGDVFQEGAPCSKCPSGTKCHSQFKALCGEVRYAERAADGDVNYDFEDVSSSPMTRLSPVLSVIVFFILLCWY